MKSMRGLLAAGALFIPVKAAKGESNSANFGVSLKIVHPLEIHKTSDVDFGTLTTEQVKTGGVKGTGTYTVTGTDYRMVKFGLSSPDYLSDGDNTISYAADLKVRGKSAIGENTGFILEGPLEGELEITLDAQDSVMSGNYEGSVNIDVSYF